MFLEENVSTGSAISVGVDLRMLSGMRNELVDGREVGLGLFCLEVVDIWDGSSSEVRPFLGILVASDGGVDAAEVETVNDVMLDVIV